MKRLSLVFLVAGLWLAVNVGAEQGGALFESLRCGGCHKADVSKAPPSLKEMAGAYHGKEDQLTSYLRGEAGPIVKPAEGNMMKRALEKTKALSDEDRKALADFIMSHGGQHGG
jgi:cytochrome c